ncbi:hypothetical protein H9P43_002049 [Blastocladiella emersonii ATCC 22665]|nr:hypothetical protein H9P43_002049 [Blastocladiella emersonii ATCC 22665]
MKHSSALNLIACIAALALVVQAQQQDQPPVPSPGAPIGNVLPELNPHARTCIDAVAAAKRGACLAEASAEEPKLAKLWEAASKGDAKARDEYLSALTSITSDQCTRACGVEYRAASAAIAKACSVSAFGDDERFTIPEPVVTGASIAAVELVHGWQAMCMASPTSGRACAVDLARADIAATGGSALAWAALDGGAWSTAGRSAADTAQQGWIAKAAAGDAKDLACGGCTVATRQLRSIAHRASARVTDEWARAKNVVVLHPDGRATTGERRESDRSGDVAGAEAVRGLCGVTSPLTIDVEADDVSKVPALKVDADSGMVTVPAIKGYDHPGMSAWAIILIVLAVGMALGGAGVFYRQRQMRASRVPFSFQGVRDLVLDALPGSKKAQ